MPSLFEGGVRVNRGLIGFLVFLTVLVGGLAAVGYVLGPNVLAFVFHEDRRTAPVVMVNFLEFADVDAEQRYRSAFGIPARTMIEALGGHRIWSARANDVVSGRMLDGWSWLELVEYPSRAAVIELVTSSDYRKLRGARAAALKRSAVFAATQGMAFADDGTTAYAVRLLAGVERNSVANYVAQATNEDDALLAHHEGQLVWRADVDPLVVAGDQGFEAMFIYGFPDVDRRDAWVIDPARETLQTLQRRLFRRDVLLLASAGDAP